MTGFQRDLLLTVALLSGTNPSGKDIMHELESEYGAAVNHGRLYQNLGDLVDTGFIQKLPLDGRTNVYRLTERASTQLHAHYAWEEKCLQSINEETVD
ncbi:helix-turn-helix transcriptional regulator [Haladaptatus halobius]|uniref:helix-turn-helix transcriptional regulator n=1 Tax=Haladaptatus halobius TaxID=2884875 RepID=UPI001D09C243|nr:helix-turn-helix transcriptional regulator [Haladaptatus halobius]